MLSLRCMDSTPHYSTTLTPVSKDLGKGNDCPSVTTLNLDSFGVSSSYVSKESKRKWRMVDRPLNLRHESTLITGLGLASNCSTICSRKDMEEKSSDDFGLRINFGPGDVRGRSRKDMEEKSSDDLGLRINFGQGDVRGPNLEKASPTLNALELWRSKLDLELSLSTGSAESDLTTVTQGSTSTLSNSALPAKVTSVQLVDEGSISSRWKTSPLVSPLQNVEIFNPFDQLCSSGKPASKSSRDSSAAVVTSGSVAGLDNQRLPRKSSVKSCQFEGCTRGARGASGLCIAHGGGRRCQRAGCQKGAEGRTIFCKAHGGGRRCQYLGCTKSAEGRTDYCIAHGGGRRCSHDGCTRAARGKSGLCIRHGGGKRCKIENCSKSAEGVSGLCISHGGGRRCQYPGCTKGAQGSTLFCKAHGGGRRCTFLGCRKGAEGSTPFCKGHGGGKRCTFEGCTKSVHGGTLFCVSHGGGKRCAMPECTKSARGRTNYCVRHGGGKRCKFLGCTKSAQGSTDFCKAHGGGKRCSWGQLGVEFSQGVVPCDKFARGRSGLCAAHSAMMQEQQREESTVIFSSMQGPNANAFTHLKRSSAAEGNCSDCVTTDSGTTSIGSFGHGHHLVSIQPQGGNVCVGHFSLPEGRVHGGSLMEMLKGRTTFMTNNNQEASVQLEQGKTFPVPHSWV